eukprot:5059561-Prymnesium_polylepis.2
MPPLGALGARARDRSFALTYVRSAHASGLSLRESRNVLNSPGSSYTYTLGVAERNSPPRGARELPPAPRAATPVNRDGAGASATVAGPPAALAEQSAP